MERTQRRKSTQEINPLLQHLLFTNELTIKGYFYLKYIAYPIYVQNNNPKILYTKKDGFYLYDY